MIRQKEIEVILAQQLASCLSIPIFLVDTQGNLIFYNEPAEKILGCRFEESGEMSVNDWATLFEPTDEKGRPLAPEKLPLMVALTERHPSHRRFWIRGADRVRRHIEVTAIPLVGQQDRFLGALRLFWEVPEQ
jgi:PAS domain-containing protein